MRSLTRVTVILTTGFIAAAAHAQSPLPYGPPITLQVAKKVMAAAEAEASKQRWPVAIAIVDSGGYLVMLHRLENTQLGSIEICQQKAKTAVMFRRPSKAFQDLVAEGGVNLKLLRLSGIPFDGGLPIIDDGKIIGGIGVSGVRSDQDAVVGKAGLDALTRELTK